MMDENYKNDLKAIFNETNKEMLIGILIGLWEVLLEKKDNPLENIPSKRIRTEDIVADLLKERLMEMETSPLDESYAKEKTAYWIKWKGKSLLAGTSIGTIKRLLSNLDYKNKIEEIKNRKKKD